MLINNIEQILFVGRDVFESANIDSIITKITKKSCDTITILNYEDSQAVVKNIINKKTISDPFALDELSSNNLSLLKKIENKNVNKLASMALCENACATSDAYLLQSIIKNDVSGQYNPSIHYKVCNTGTLSKFIFRWGIKSMRYLKNDFLSPIVEKKSFHEIFGKSYVQRAVSPKLIIKGLTLLDAAIDFGGEYIPGKSTLVVPCKNIVTLKFLAALLNSKLIFFYISEKYASSSYNGGIGFTKDMINELPMPLQCDVDWFAARIDEIIRLQTDLNSLSLKFITFLRAEFLINEVGGKLEHWYELDYNQFTKELSKKKAVVPKLAKRAEWMEYFDKQKTQAVILHSKLDTINGEIDRMLYKMYGLTADETVVVERHQ